MTSSTEQDKSTVKTSFNPQDIELMGLENIIPTTPNSEPFKIDVPIKAFRLDNPWINAIQFTGSGSAAAICLWLASLGVPSHYTEAEDTLEFWPKSKHNSDPHILNVGGWIVRDSSNIFHPYTESEFEDLTEKYTSASALVRSTLSDIIDEHYGNDSYTDSVLDELKRDLVDAGYSITGILSYE